MGEEYNNYIVFIEYNNGINTISPIKLNFLQENKQLINNIDKQIFLYEYLNNNPIPSTIKKELLIKLIEDQYNINPSKKTKEIYISFIIIIIDNIYFVIYINNTTTNMFPIDKKIQNLILNLEKYINYEKKILNPVI
jgi:hypothetical protein